MKTADRVDNFVARFTRNLLNLAVKENVPFSYAGNRGGKVAEINRTMAINGKVVKALLSKK